MMIFWIYQNHHPENHDFDDDFLDIPKSSSKSSSRNHDFDDDFLDGDFDDDFLMIWMIIKKS